MLYEWSAMHSIYVKATESSLRGLMQAPIELYLETCNTNTRADEPNANFTART